jgi:hypothetical protein
MAAVVLDFAELLFAEEKDLAVGFCTTLIAAATQDKSGWSPQEGLALLLNPRLGAAVARVNRAEKNPPTFIDQLVRRPQLAKAVAQAMSVESRVSEEVSI